MTAKPFIYTPDVFLLQVPIRSPGITISSFESEWGTTDEKLCFYNGILIGLAHKETSGQNLIVSLVPKLDSQRRYPWPLQKAFGQALLACVKSLLGSEILCERDADQHPVEVITDPGAFEPAIEAALAYCEGESSSCPSFVVRHWAKYQH